MKNYTRLKKGYITGALVPVKEPDKWPMITKDDIALAMSSVCFNKKPKKESKK